MVGSTELGERLDPESVRHVMSRLFEVVRPMLERHGGTVEKFIGDAVMAVFGVPTVHEDDALRACRAALEIQDEIGRLNKEFERDWGMTISTRTGLNTGEVIAGDPTSGQTLVTGDPVNTAARLEQAAAAGHCADRGADLSPGDRRRRGGAGRAGGSQGESRSRNRVSASLRRRRGFR